MPSLTPTTTIADPSGSKRPTHACGEPNSCAISLVTAEKISSGLTPRATSVATRRSAACSSASSPAPPPPPPRSARAPQLAGSRLRRCQFGARLVVRDRRGNEVDEVAEAILGARRKHRAYLREDAHLAPNGSIDHDWTRTTGTELRRPRHLTDCSRRCR